MAWFRRKQKTSEPLDPTAEELAADEISALEGGDAVPSDPGDWPSGKAKYLTFGNEDDDRYGDGATSKLGPAEVAHHDDGSVTVGGKVVDNPQDYKGRPITGGIMNQLLEHAERNRKLAESESEPEDERKRGR